MVAALTLAAGMALPVFGRLIDRHGQHRVLVPMVLAFGVLMLLLTAGVPMPVAGPLVRARWTKIYAGTDKLRIAYGFESATIEVAARPGG